MNRRLATIPAAETELDGRQRSPKNVGMGSKAGLGCEAALEAAHCDRSEAAIFLLEGAKGRTEDSANKKIGELASEGGVD